MPHPPWTRHSHTEFYACDVQMSAKHRCSCINVTHVTLRYVDEYEYKEMTPKEIIESTLHFIFLYDTGKYLNYDKVKFTTDFNTL